MEKWILTLETDLEKFEMARNELLSLSINMRMVSAMQDVIAELSKKNDYLIVMICSEEEDYLTQLPQLRDLTVGHIVIMKNVYNPEEQQKALDLGADRYIERPKTVGESISSTYAMIRHTMQYCGKTGWCKNNYIVKNVTLSVNCHKVFIGETEIVLGKKEFDLMYLFMRSPKNVISCGDIFASVWADEGFEDYGTNVESAVYTLVKRLRKALKIAIDAKKCIRNIPKVGYIFDPYL